ncbi:flagellar filament capping protein FliD [Megalodesulfovibrio paquesii]
MTEYWSGSITFTGLGSGTDFDSVIEATMAVESYRLNQMEAWDEMWSAKLEQVQAISTALTEYQTFLSSIDTESEFLVKTATSSNTSVVSASAGSDALEGSHTIEVGQVAKNDVWTTTTGWTSTDDVVTTTDATFAIQYGDETMEIDVPAGTTVEGFVSLINNNTKMGNSVRASLINDGDEIHLQLRGLDLGADNAVTIVDPSDSANAITGLAAADFEHTQTAQNAKIKVDGYPSTAGKWIERDTNTISDVVDGLSFTLLDDSDGETVTISVATDTEAVIANIESFITQTNAIRDAIRALDETDTDTSVSVTEDDDDSSGTDYAVRGNYGMDIIEQALQDILASSGLGFVSSNKTAEGDTYTLLAAIGITTDVDENSTSFGNLVIDYDELESALDADPDAVARLFSAENDGVSYDATVGFNSSVAGITKPGAYDVEYTVSGGQIVSATIGGQEASVDGWAITSVTGDATGLAVDANMHEDGTYTGTVYIRQGKINQTLDQLSSYTTADNGTLQIIEDSYQEIIDNNLEAIEREEARLERKEQYLIEKYASLEALLGEYEDISEGLETQLDSLPSVS